MVTREFIKKNAPWIFSGIGIAIAKAVHSYFKEENKSIVDAIIIGVIIVFIAIIAIELIQFLKRKNFGHYVKCKIRESFHLLLGDKETYLPSEYKYDVYEIHEQCHKLVDALEAKYGRLANLLNKFICYNQGVYANYNFMAGELHKKIKEELRGDSPNRKNIKDYSINLVDYLGSNFSNNILRRNHDEYILEYFKGRSEYDPRIVVKACNGDKMVDIFRFRFEYFKEYARSDNSGFEHVHKYGTYFICNNIPEKAAVDTEPYVNPRLVNDKVKNYINHLNNKGIEDDHGKWRECWVPNTIDEKEVLPSPDSCYKSTLIIPMTLVNNQDLSAQFRRHFKIPDPTNAGEEGQYGRAVYGFLCFDHREINYFDKDLDVKVGYTFADILSMYLIQYVNYVTYSKTFGDALKEDPELQSVLEN